MSAAEGEAAETAGKPTYAALTAATPPNSGRAGRRGGMTAHSQDPDEVTQESLSSALASVRPPCRRPPVQPAEDRRQPIAGTAGANSDLLSPQPGEAGRGAQLTFRLDPTACRIIMLVSMTAGWGIRLWSGHRLNIAAFERSCSFPPSAPLR